MKRKASFIGIVIVACTALFLCWAEVQNSTRWQGLADLQQEIIAEQQINQALTSLEYNTEIGAYAQYIEQLEAEIEVPMELRDFTSVDELTRWLAKDRTDEMLIIVADNGVCEDYALRLQENGIELGFKVNFQILYDKQFYEHYGKHLKEGTYHAVNSVIIGNEFWYIEPQSDEIWLAAYLD